MIETGSYKQSGILDFEKADLVAAFGANPQDTGNVKVQIALTQRRIAQLSRHLIANRKDLHSNRGLRCLINQRASLLRYLRNNDPASAATLTEVLGIPNR